MSWIPISEKLPPRGLDVLLEVSGRYSAPYSIIADHSFFIGSLIKTEPDIKWLIWDSCSEDNHHILYPTVHAWMPLPKHYAPQEEFQQDPDLMEHAMFEKDPDWLYKGDAVWEGQQMSIEEYLQQEANHD